MESRQRRVWHQAAAALFYTRFAQCHARLRRGSIQHARRVDSIPSLRDPPKLAHSLRGTPTAAWITKKELLVDKSSFVVGCGGGSWYSFLLYLLQISFGLSAIRRTTRRIAQDSVTAGIGPDFCGASVMFKAVSSI